MTEAAISLVLFDLGDVVARYDPIPRIAEYAECAALPADEVKRRLWETGFSEDCDRGRYDADTMHAELERRLGVSFEREQLLRLQALAFALRPDMLELSRALATQVRVGLLTNNSALLEEALPTQLPELCAGFDPLLFSWRFGCSKPDQRLFRAVATRLALEPARILFVDDQARNVRAAVAAGFQALRFESPAALRREFAERELAR